MMTKGRALSGQNDNINLVQVLHGADEVGAARIRLVLVPAMRAEEEVDGDGGT